MMANCSRNKRASIELNKSQKLVKILNKNYTAKIG